MYSSLDNTTHTGRQYSLVTMQATLQPPIILLPTLALRCRQVLHPWGTRPQDMHMAYPLRPAIRIGEVIPSLILHHFILLHTHLAHPSFPNQAAA